MIPIPADLGHRVLEGLGDKIRAACAAPYTWRTTVPHDLDWMPQMSQQLLAVRYYQKIGVLKWPATTLCFGSTVVAVIGFVPREDGSVDIWSAFSPFAALAGYGVARACKLQLPRLRQAVGPRTVVMEVEIDDPVATRFAKFLGFKSSGTARWCEHTEKWRQVFQWSA